MGAVGLMRPLPPLRMSVVMDDRLWGRSRQRRRRREPMVDGWYDTETREGFIVLAGLRQHDAVHGIASTVLHEVIHATSSRACEEHVANVEKAMMDWTGW